MSSSRKSRFHFSSNNLLKHVNTRSLTKKLKNKRNGSEVKNESSLPKVTPEKLDYTPVTKNNKPLEG